MLPTVDTIKRNLSLSLDDGSLLAFAIRVGPLLVLFMLLDRGFQKVLRLPEESYFQHSILFGGPDKEHLAIWIGALLVGSVLCWLFKGFRLSWAHITAGYHVRWFLGILIASLLWSFAAYPMNYHYGQEHFLDRGALVVLALLTLWRPIFCLLLVPAFWTVISQFHYPLSTFPIVMAEFRPLLQILTLFCAFLLLQAKSGLARIEHFIFLTGCLVAANFWQPGLLKVKMDWISHGHLYGMHVGAYAHGWLGWLSPEKISTFAGWMAKADYPLRIATLAIELCAILFFVRGAVAKKLLLIWTLLLVAFFACFGYFFWKWMLVHLGLLILLRHWEDEGSRQSRLFHWKGFVLAIPIIGAASITFQSAGLAWYDTPLTHSYRYEALGESGKRYAVPTRLLAPYHEEFTMAYFDYLYTNKSLVSPYGATIDREVAKRLTDADSPSEAAAIIEEFGGQGFSKELESRFVALLTEWLEEQNEDTANGESFRWRHPLPFLWNFRQGETFQHQEPIVRLFVVRETHFYDGDTIHQLEAESLAIIEAKLD